MRLRRRTLGGDVVWKLGQKVRLDGDDPERRLTNLYLDAGDAAALAARPASVPRKTRWAVAWRGHRLGIDVFEGRHQGLVPVEVELEADEPHLPPPPGAIVDVTHDDPYSGGRLAAMTDHDLELLPRSPAVSP